MDKEAFLIGYNNGMTPVQQCHIFGMLCKEADFIDMPDEWFTEVSNAPMSKEASTDDILYLSFINGYTEKIAQIPATTTATTVTKKPAVAPSPAPTTVTGHVLGALGKTPWGQKGKKWLTSTVAGAVPTGVKTQMADQFMASQAGQKYKQDYINKMMKDPKQLQGIMGQLPKGFMTEQAGKWITTPEGQKFKQAQIAAVMKDPKQLQAIMANMPAATKSKMMMGQIMPMIKKYLPWLAIGGGALMGLTGMGAGGGRGGQRGGYPQYAPRPPMMGYPMNTPMRGFR